MLKPTIVCNCVLEITPELLKSWGIKGLILDLDNTLTTHNNKKPALGVLDWIGRMKAAEIGLIIVSNNSHARVLPFAEQLGLEFISNGMKPLSRGISKAMGRLGLPISQLAVVGDQLFTDILGAKICHIKTIFVFPFEAEKGFLFAVKRLMEKPFLPKRRA